MVVLSSVAVVHVRRVAKSTNARAVFFFSFLFLLLSALIDGFAPEKKKELVDLQKALALSQLQSPLTGRAAAKEGYPKAAQGGAVWLCSQRRRHGDISPCWNAITPSQGFLLFGRHLSSPAVPAAAADAYIDEFLAFLFLTVSEAQKPRYQRLFVSFSLKKEGTARCFSFLCFKQNNPRQVFPSSALIS